MIVLDASVLIAHLDAADAHHHAATAILTAAAGEAFFASPLSLAEVLVGPARAGRLAAAVQALDRLGVSGVDLDEGSPVRLAELRAGTGLKLPDCCVLLAAQQVQGVIATFDRPLATAARRSGVGVRTANPS